MSDPQVPEPVPANAQPVGRGGHPVLVYTLLRLLVLVVVGAVLYLVGLRDLWLLLFAFLVSGVVSAFALRRPREAATGGVVTTVQKVNQRIDASARAEDGPADGAAPRGREVPADDDLDQYAAPDEPRDER